MIGKLDVVGRREGHDLRASTTPDAEDGLRRLRAVDVRRKTRTRLTAAVLVLGVMSAGVLGRAVLAREEGAPAHPAPGNVQHPEVCRVAGVGVECLAGGALRFDLADPVRWVFEACCNKVAAGDPTATEVEVEDIDLRQGVLITEMARPATTLGQPAGGFGPSPSPRRFAEWLASRPYLHATTPTRTTLAGHEGWTVRARIAKGAGPGKGLCGQLACYPLTVSRTAATSAGGGGGMNGIWGSMLVDFTFLSLPKGTTVVWSWTFDDDPASLKTISRDILAGITWPGD